MLQIQDHGGVREIRLDRPPANALSPDLLAELAQALLAAPEAGAGAVVLSGAEGMFSAGLDVPLFVELDRTEVTRAWQHLFDVMEALVGSPIPVVAALTGHAPAGGCVLALCCDWRILAEGKFKIGLNEVQVGVRMPKPILAVAQHVVGMRQAERMATTAVLMDGTEALRIGLVDEVVPVAEVVPTAVAWAERQLALPPATLRRTRQLARRDMLRELEKNDETELETFLDDWFSDEAQGALRALVEQLASKRK